VRGVQPKYNRREAVLELGGPAGLESSVRVQVSVCVCVCVCV
jgi:hypothetical protein